MQKVLFIGYVWPESKSTAAGRRMLQLIDFFQAQGFQVWFGSPAQKGQHPDDLQERGVVEVELPLNSDSVDQWLTELNLDVVVFDRYMMEEQFGWRVRKCCPKAMTVLDMEDVHGLRFERQDQFLKGSISQKSKEIKLRELAAVLRCDLTLVISTFEMDYLKSQGIPAAILAYVPFIEDLQPQYQKSFEEKQHFIMIGNFIHEPNAKAVDFIYQQVWPKVRKQLPAAELHVYGAYLKQSLAQLNQPKKGFYIKGWTEDAIATIADYKLLLAPVFFGAGLKGKLFDAVKAGTAFLSSAIGQEGIEGLPTAVSERAEDWVHRMVEVYQNNTILNDIESQQRGAIQSQFVAEEIKMNLAERISAVQSQLEAHRGVNLLGQVLNLQNMQASQYLSKYIMAKNKLQE